MRRALAICAGLLALHGASSAVAAVPPASPDSALINLDCIISLSSGAIEAAEAGGEEIDPKTLSAVVAYFLGRYQGASGENGGEALNARALQGVDVHAAGLSETCTNILDSVGLALERATPGMEEVERRIREANGAD